MSSVHAIPNLLRQGSVLRSIRHPNAEVTVFHRDRDLEVAMVEVDGGGAVAEPYLWSACSWHLVLEGQAIFEQGRERRELLHDESLYLPPLPYRVNNPAPGRVKLLTLLFPTTEGSERAEGELT